MVELPGGNKTSKKLKQMKKAFISLSEKSTKAKEAFISLSEVFDKLNIKTQIYRSKPEVNMTDDMVRITIDGKRNHLHRFVNFLEVNKNGTKR